mmetsp:Transcript_62183/g.181539  ORF Transcript_62183/g.181539 Transcript_62183/m.181539 type:complete len:493 (+) Transcript_62183:81-1559(+)
MDAGQSAGGQRKSVRFDEMAGKPGEDEKKEEGMSRIDFLNTFSELVARRDYNGALKVCRERLKVKPDDRYVIQMRQTVERYLDNAEDLDDEDEPESLPTLEELKDQADAATGRAFEAMFTYLQDEEKLWELGEQAVGIFWDVGLVAPWGKRRERLLEMSKSLTETLGRKLKGAGRHGEGLPAMSVAADLGGSEWLFEGLGQLWWRSELNMEREDWLLDGCREEWEGRSMEQMVGLSEEGLGTADLGALTDVLVQAWALERVSVCGLFGEQPTPALEYGVREVLAEIRRRPLVEPPLAGFYECFYLMTHVVYVLNCFNGHLPNRRTDCPWLYAYLERCLGFWLREVRRDFSQLPDVVAATTWGAEAVDAISEAVDCLKGLDDESETDHVREGLAWLLSRQDADGFFWSPRAQRPTSNEYDHIHPTWTAVAALQLDREVPGPSPRSAAWAHRAREAAREAEFAKPPPLPDLGSLAPDGAELEADEGEDGPEVEG